MNINKIEYFQIITKDVDKDSYRKVIKNIFGYKKWYTNAYNFFFDPFRVNTGDNDLTL